MLARFEHLNEGVAMCGRVGGVASRAIVEIGTASTFEADTSDNGLALVAICRVLEAEIDIGFDFGNSRGVVGIRHGA